VKLVAQWSRIESGLPADWGSAQLTLEVEGAAARARAAALLGPASPGLAGRELRFEAERSGGPAGPDGVRRLLARVDEERIAGTLTLLEAARAEASVASPVASLAEGWDEALAALPPDWSDLYCELELTSSDYLDRAALLAAPLNPARDRSRLAFHFRVARSFGYGVSPGMTRRCLERLDADRIRGSVRVLRALSDTHNAATQGPVWRVGGKAV
jgi:hypothetical protein